MNALNTQHVRHEASLPFSELAARVRLSLARFRIRRIGIDVAGSTVTLSGDVTTFYEKQLAQEFCRRVSGVIRVVNDIHVLGQQASPPHNDQESVPLSA